MVIVSALLQTIVVAYVLVVLPAMLLIVTRTVMVTAGKVHQDGTKEQVEQLQMIIAAYVLVVTQVTLLIVIRIVMVTVSVTL